MRVRIGGIELEGFAIFRDGFVSAPQLEKGVAEIVVSIPVSGIDPQRFAKLEHRFLRPALLERDKAKVVVGNEIVPGAIKRASPEGFAVIPISGLMIRQNHQSR